jgi:hypothetical protein
VRTLVCFSLFFCAIGALAQSPQDQVLAVYRQLESAVQSGDANHTFVGLWSREKAPDAEKMRALLRPHTDVHYTLSKVFVQANQAVLLAQYGQNGFLNMRFIREDGRWKINDIAYSDKAYPPASVYAIIPPPPGAFARAGEPWQSMPQALSKADATRQGWQLRAACDESFLYIRIQSSALIPAPGSGAKTPPMGWPVMKIGVSGVGEFVLHVTASIGDHATFDQHGHANSHRSFVAYWLMLERANHMIFQSWADLNPNPLVQAGGNLLEVRVPLRTMGVTDAAHTKIVIGDAAWPKSAIFTLEARHYQ